MNKNNQRKILLTGLVLGMFFSSLDQTIVGTAMPRIIGELGGLGILTWVATIYMLASTSVAPIAGKLADILGRRSIYVSGILIFMFGSALCGLSQNMTELIVFRGIQGIGGGIMMPLALTIVGDIFPPGKRGKWQGMMGALFGISAITGPLIGGWIVDHATWRWVFYINMPFGILAAASIYIGLHGEKALKEKVEIDYAGAFTLVAAVASLLLGLTLGGKDFPWNSFPIIGLIAASLAFFSAFIYVEKRAADPILSLDLFKNRTFTITNSIGFLMGTGMFGTIMFLPLYLQGVTGMKATKSGGIMAPMVIGIVLSSIVSGRLIRRFQFRVFFILGMLFEALGFYFLSSMNSQTTQIQAIYYVILVGCGIGMIMPALTISVQSAFPIEQRGVATSSTQFFRSIGATFGMAIFGAIMNFRSVDILKNELFPKIQGIKELNSGVLGSMMEKAHTNPQSMYNMLLKPDSLNKIPADILKIILPPLKAALADSLHLVFFTAVFVAIAGALIGILLGSARIDNPMKNKIAGEELSFDSDLVEES